jgi:hypothetical protein
MLVFSSCSDGFGDIVSALGCDESDGEGVRAMLDEVDFCTSTGKSVGDLVTACVVEDG